MSAVFTHVMTLMLMGRATSAQMNAVTLTGKPGK